MTTPHSDMKAKETAPQFSDGSGGDDGLDVPSKPIRDPSLDTLLEGLEERIDQDRPGARLRVHTPPNAGTDPFPEEAVVAPHMTAPLAALKAQKQAAEHVRAVADRAANALPARKDEPTFLLGKPEQVTKRSALVGVGAVLVIAGALGIAVWVARGDTETNGPLAEPDPSAPLALPIPSRVVVPASAVSAAASVTGPASAPASSQSVQTAPSGHRGKPAAGAAASAAHGSKPGSPSTGAPGTFPGYQYPD